MRHSDIIVVGGGPAGLSFCRSLAGSGLSITVVDNHDAAELENAPFDGREIALTHPSKHTLEATGIWQHIPSNEIYNLREASVVNGDSPYSLHFPLPETNRKNQPIETLGYLVTNHLIRRAAYAACLEQDNITWCLGRKVVSAKSDANAAYVTLDDETQLSADLLIAADSRFSFVRREMGIPTDMHDFGRTVMVFRLEHTISNDHTAFECFFYGSTLALLPLTDNMTNCVVTIDTRKLHTLKAMNDEELANHIAEQVDHRFGEMKLASTIHDYPLMGVHARRFYANRCALVGDAACGMHPVTAHGFNLGLQSQAILSRLILRQAGQGKDIGAAEVLTRYHREHVKNTRLLYHGTNAIVKLFTQESRPAKIVRDGVLRLSNRLPPLKTLITRQLTG
ncbi:5-demethoxyubiquinol-8 5-hydroxylase UbiM [Suttonella sp. R2A3]|nr:5-demethoxyubiquinol-8 5-hydroxylase UbiM [Suttonella sp. R2A3]UJF25181.1 5-demethoxyubiquinol-8 5-hydroxylase UbiM [Suttonella sp. R2A3]UJF25184.1 5-demethoxyubiquinol-8 5-hydroxylase UbiM [Suttonella sp. R2A3]